MDYSKITGNKYFKIAAWIVLPTIAVAGYYGVKYIIDKSEKKKIDAELQRMRDKYSEINSLDDFFEGIKYLEYPNQYGYDFTQFINKKQDFEKMGMDKLKRFYELSKKNSFTRNDDEDKEWLDLIHIVYP